MSRTSAKAYSRSLIVEAQITEEISPEDHNAVNDRILDESINGEDDLAADADFTAPTALAKKYVNPYQLKSKALLRSEKGTGANINTGTDDVKYITPKAASDALVKKTGSTVFSPNAALYFINNLAITFSSILDHLQIFFRDHVAGKSTLLNVAGLEHEKTSTGLTTNLGFSEPTSNTTYLLRSLGGTKYIATTEDIAALTGETTDPTGFYPDWNIATAYLIADAPIYRVHDGFLYELLVDDTGTEPGTDDDVWLKTNVVKVLQKNMQYQAESITLPSASVNSLNVVEAANFILLEYSGAATIKGISKLSQSRLMIFKNNTGDVVTLADYSVDAASNEKIVTGTGADITMLADSCLFLLYNYAAGVWQVIGGTGGGGSGTLSDVLAEGNDGGGIEIENIADGTAPDSAATVGQAQDMADTAESNAKTYADGLVVGLWDDRGNYDASTNAYPSSGGSGSAGAILKGDVWTISVGGTLPTGQNVEVGDVVRALIDTPGATQSNWAIQEHNLGYTAENSVNKATTMTGNTASNTVYLSAKAVYDWAIGLFQPILTDTVFGAFLTGLTAKATPIDADQLTIVDSADSNKAKKVTFANLKATEKVYFDTLYGSLYLAMSTQAGTTYTLAIGDSNTLVRFSNASAVTVTIPLNSTVGYTIGTTIRIRQSGAGVVTVSPTGGVTVNAPDGLLVTGKQYDEIWLVKQATDTWMALVGAPSYWTYRLGVANTANGLWTFNAGIKFAAGQSILDANGNVIISFSATTTAVNRVQFINAATGGVPQLIAEGTDSNISFRISSKGTGSLFLRTNGTDRVSIDSSGIVTFANYTATEERIISVSSAGIMGNSYKVKNPVLHSQYTDGTTITITVKTSLLKADTGSKTISSADINRVGATLKFEGFAKYSTGATPDTMRLDLDSGATNLGNKTFSGLPVSVTDEVAFVTIVIKTKVAGAAGELRGFVKVTTTASGSLSSDFVLPISATGVDLTANPLIDLFLTWGTGAMNSWTGQSGELKIIA
jgi:hypothetical protein